MQFKSTNKPDLGPNRGLNGKNFVADIQQTNFICINLEVSTKWQKLRGKDWTIKIFFTSLKNWLENPPLIAADIKKIPNAN